MDRISLSIFACLLVAGSLVSALGDWNQFKAQHGKKYANPLEEKMRQAIFMKNKLEVERFNEQQAAEVGFKLGLNHLSDRTKEELSILRGYKAPKGSFVRKNSPEAERFLARVLGDRSRPLPKSIDWRAHPGRVTPVKNQGQCGSCWAFSSTGALEGQQFNVTRSKKLISLSEQNLVDCVKGEGCNGGLQEDAFAQIKREGGIVDEASYPYTARDGKVCKFKKANAVMTDSGSAYLEEGDEHVLQEMVAKFGPVAVAIDASPDAFQLYESGVYKSSVCGNDHQSLDHGVLVVGYGTENGQDYWIVKNSWSEKWGDQGYMKMARNSNNMCGIATQAIVPTF